MSMLPGGTDNATDFNVEDAPDGLPNVVAPNPGFAVRFNANGANSPFVAWFGDQPSARDYALMHIRHQAVVVQITAYFQ